MREGYQQGDVLFVGVSALPREAIRTQPHQGRYVLVEGEHTGHSHDVSVGEVEVYITEAGEQFVKILGEQATVTHHTHAPQVLEAKQYQFFKIEQVREIDPFSGEIDSVQD